MLLSILLQATAGAALGTVAAALGTALSVIAASIGISKIGDSAMQSIARQPEAAGDIRMSMILSAAFIEGAALFGIVVCGFILG